MKINILTCFFMFFTILGYCQEIYDIKDYCIQKKLLLSICN